MFDLQYPKTKERFSLSFIVTSTIMLFSEIMKKNRMFAVEDVHFVLLEHHHLLSAKIGLGPTSSVHKNLIPCIENQLQPLIGYFQESTAGATLIPN